MPVSHGNNHIKIMTEAHQYFSIWEPFLYTPLSDPSVQLTIVAVPEPEHKIRSSCRGLCELYSWCCKEKT